MVPTLVENSLCTCLLTVLQNEIIMTGEPTHTASKERNNAACPSYQLSSLKSKVFIILFCQLCSTRYTAL